MLFSGITFLYFFLPLTLLLYGVVPRQFKNSILCVMSCVFYAWGEPVYLFLMLIQIAIVYGLTLLMEKKRDTKAGKYIMRLTVLLPFASLFFFKYFSFLLRETLGFLGIAEKSVPSELLHITLPIGISFYTFQLVSYVVDVWRRECVAQKSVIKLATYITMFPQLIAGPIVRYKGTDKALDDREIHVADYADGIVRFTIGLSKKVLIANALGEFVKETAGMAGNSIVLAWGYALAVTLQIYFDFSGYSDMAIGLGGMLGFQFPENFRYPLISASVTEFWRRWHMTLGSWFRDYVYIPLGGNRTSNVKWIRNILVVWVLTGVWHGAGWNFLIWGLYFAVLLMLEKFVAKGFALLEVGKVGSYVLLVLRHVYVLVMILVSFLIFNGLTLQAGWQDICNLWKAPVWGDEISAYMIRNRAGLLVIAVIGATPLPKKAWEKLASARLAECFLRVVQFAGTAVLFLLCTAYLIDGSFNPFLYFRF